MLLLRRARPITRTHNLTCEHGPTRLCPYPDRRMALLGKPSLRWPATHLQIHRLLHGTIAIISKVPITMECQRLRQDSMRATRRLAREHTLHPYHLHMRKLMSATPKSDPTSPHRPWGMAMSRRISSHRRRATIKKCPTSSPRPMTQATRLHMGTHQDLCRRKGMVRHHVGEAMGLPVA